MIQTTRKPIETATSIVCVTSTSHQAIVERPFESVDSAALDGTTMGRRSIKNLLDPDEIAQRAANHRRSSGRPLAPRSHKLDYNLIFQV
jgi:hypothetical protein